MRSLVFVVIDLDSVVGSGTVNFAEGETQSVEIVVVALTIFVK
jgi:hypothetical protein